MAQEREKRRIVIASILKPVDDTRMFGKMGVSLASTGTWQVTIIGFPTTVPSYPGIEFIQLKSFTRLSLGRWLAKWKVLIEAWRRKPALFIFSTHELLIPALILKVMRSSFIVYDVRENFYRNIAHSEGLPTLLRWPLAMLVRLKEKLLAPAVDHFLLAEKGYEQEFRFHRGGWTVIENKALSYPKSSSGKKDSGKLQLLFSGTLAESTGVFRAIRLAKALHAVNHMVTLTIIGYASTPSIRKRIRDETNSLSFIHLIGIDTLVQHQDIVELIQRSDAGILSYPISDLTRNSVPTKLWEYLQGHLPIILEHQWHWIDRYAPYNPFCFVDFDDPDCLALLDELKTKTFYTSYPTDVSWESEGSRFLACIRKLRV